MARLGVYLTYKRKILVTSCASSLPTLLGKTKTGETKSVMNSWFYTRPLELEDFLKKNPEKTKQVDKALAYWVSCDIFKQPLKETAHGVLKRQLKKFNTILLKVIRNLVNRIVKQIRISWAHQKKMETKNLHLLRKKSITIHNI